MNLSRDRESRRAQPPGSVNKIRVLTERAARREPLFHPEDNLKRALQTPEAEAEAEEAYKAELVG